MVYIVGAGPGDPELITVKGQRLLSEADVIIYAGSLVNPALLDYAKADCQIYNSASMTLGDVIETITSAVQEGKMVVRLHTGLFRNRWMSFPAAVLNIPLCRV